MAKVFEIGFKIGGQIKKSFSGSLTSATKNLDALQKQLGVLETGKAGIEKFKNLRRAIATTQSQFEQTSQKTKDLKKQLEQTNKPTKQLKNAFKATQAQAGKLKDKLNQQRDSLHRLKQGMRQTGMETKNLARQQGELARSIDRTARAQARLRRVSAAQQKLKNRRGELRGQMFDAIGMGYLIQAPFRPAIEFEHAMRAAKVRTGAAGNQAKSKILEDKARELGRTTPFKATEVAQAMTELGIAGYGPEATKKATKDVLDLAMSTGLTVDLARSAEILSNVANQFGLKDETTKVADALVRGFSKSSTTLEYIYETMKYLAILPRDAGLSVEETMGAVGLLGNVGIKGSLAGTAIKRSLQNIKTGSKALEQLNVQRYEVVNGEKRLRNYYTILGDILKGLQRYDKEAQDLFIYEIFGDRAVAAMSEMLKQVGEGGVDEILNKMSTAFGAGQTGAEMMKTTKGTFLELASALESLSISFAQLFLPTLKSAASIMKMVTTDFESFVNLFPFGSKVIGFVVFGLAGLKVVTIGLQYAFSFLASGLLMPIKLLANLSAILALVKTRTIGTAIALKLLSVGINVDKLRAFGMAIWTFSKGALTMLVSGLGIVRTAVWSFTTTAIPALIAGIKAVGVAILTTPVGWIAVAIAGVAAAVWYFWEPIKDAYNWIIDKLSSWNLFDSGVNLIKSFAAGIWSVATLPFRTVGKVLSYVRDLLPFSDAHRGPLSDLTKSGMSVVQTLGVGITRAGSSPLERPLSKALGQLRPSVPTPISLDEWCRQKGIDRWPGRSESKAVGKREVAINLNINANGDTDEKAFRRIVEEALPKALEKVANQELRISYAQ